MAKKKKFDVAKLGSDNLDDSVVTSVRLSRSWLQKMERFLSEESILRDFRYSTFARINAERFRLFYLKSPYIIKNAEHFVFVNADANVFYHYEEELRSNAVLHSVPVYVGMRQHKVDYFLRNGCSLDDFKSAWSYHLLRAWKEGYPRPEGLVDKVGATKKHKNIVIDSPKGRTFFREAFGVLKNYAYRFRFGEEFPLDLEELEKHKDKIVSELIAETDEDYFDYANFDIVLPTMRYEVIVCVDDDAYKDSVVSSRYVDLFVRNNEDVRFSENSAQRIAIMPEGLPHTKRFFSRDDVPIALNSNYGDDYFAQESLQKIRSKFDYFHNHLQGSSLNFNSVSLKLPKKIRCYRAVFFLPSVGLEISLNWKKLPFQG